MSLVVWSVDEMSTIQEFLDFFPCKLGLSVEAMADTILNELWQLDLSNDQYWGWGYDGAAARIQAINREAIHVHCNQMQTAVNQQCDG